MTKKDIQVGAVYIVRINGKYRHLRVKAIVPHPHYSAFGRKTKRVWYECIDINTLRLFIIRSAAKFRRTGEIT